MTKRKTKKQHLVELGNIIYNHRMNLLLEKDSRSYFLDDRTQKGLLKENTISEKTLSNIENGYNLPSLPTLVYLSDVLEIDLNDLLDDIKPFILE